MHSYRRAVCIAAVATVVVVSMATGSQFVDLIVASDKCLANASAVANGDLALRAVSGLRECAFLCESLLGNRCYGIQLSGSECRAFSADGFAAGWGERGCGQRRLAVRRQAERQLTVTNCTQSSLYSNDIRVSCYAAIDGNLLQLLLNIKSCSHTLSDTGAWWQGSLNAAAVISRIRVYNRLDCCSDRLTNFRVEVNGTSCAVYNSSVVFSVLDMPCGVHGSVVRVTSGKVSTPLTICEILLFTVA